MMSRSSIHTLGKLLFTVFGFGIVPYLAPAQALPPLPETVAMSVFPPGVFEDPHPPRGRISGPLPLDRGGSVDDYFRRAAEMATDHAEKRIEGTCVSACTIYLSVPNVCVTRTANLWFHAPFNEGYRISLFARNRMLDAYPARIREYVELAHAMESVDFRVSLSGAQLIQMGIRECSPR